MLYKFSFKSKRNNIVIVMELYLHCANYGGLQSEHGCIAFHDSVVTTDPANPAMRGAGLGGPKLWC